jgi:hypothetical protein
MKHISFVTELLDFYNPEPDQSGEGSLQQTSHSTSPTRRHSGRDPESVRSDLMITGKRFNNADS